MLEATVAFEISAVGSFRQGLPEQPRPCLLLWEIARQDEQLDTAALAGPLKTRLEVRHRLAWL